MTDETSESTGGVETSESTGGAGKGTGNRVRTKGNEPPSSSAADVRRTIVVTLADDQKLTPDEVEQAVSVKLPGARHGIVSTQLKVLQDGDYVGPVEGNSRLLSLTDLGKRWLSGIRALSGERRSSSA